MGKTFHHVEKLLKAQTPPVSVPIPIAELGPYFESASEMPRGWWAEEAILIRVTVVELKQKRWSKPPKTQKFIGQVHSACLAALSTAGWRWQVPPFQPIFLTRNGVQVCPHLWIESLLNKSMSAISFQGMLEKQGLEKIELTDVGEIKQLLM